MPACGWLLPREGINLVQTRQIFPVSPKVLWVSGFLELTLMSSWWSVHAWGGGLERRGGTALGLGQHSESPRSTGTHFQCLLGRILLVRGGCFNHQPGSC